MLDIAFLIMSCRFVLALPHFCDVVGVYKEHKIAEWDRKRDIAIWHSPEGLALGPFVTLVPESPE